MRYSIRLDFFAPPPAALRPQNPNPFLSCTTYWSRHKITKKKIRNRNSQLSWQLCRQNNWIA